MSRLLILIFCFLFSIPAYSQQNSIYDSIMQNVREVLWHNEFNITSLDKNVNEFINTIQEDGQWTDIQYNSHTQTNWNPGVHLNRLKKMINAYTNIESSYFHDKHLETCIVQALNFWYQKDPRSTNWWVQQIFCPKAIGEILILMRSAGVVISPILEKNLLVRMAKIGGHPNNQYCVSSGSNKINIAEHWIYRGCLTQNDSVFQVGLKEALFPVKYSAPGLGVQYDLSYQEHGKQLYIGNYGYAFVDNIANIALYLNGTSCALSGDQLDLFQKFTIDTYLNSIRGQYYAFSIPGRQIANKNNLFRGGNLDQLLRLKKIDARDSSIYDATAMRWSGRAKPEYAMLPKHDHYWISDFIRHIRPQYYFDVRFVSDRTVRTENINHENKLGYFLSDGATNMTIRGDEYYNIFPTWDWCKIPGTTAPQMDTLTEMPVDVGGYAGTSHFAGGVSDSLNGASVYQLDYPKFKISGNKAWFFFENKILCMGNQIRSENEFPIATTINQSLYNGVIQYGKNGKIQSFKGNKEIHFDQTPEWILHDGFAYYFPKQNNLILRTAIQTGSWQKIATLESDAPIEKNVFSLWFDHGTKPANTTYSYLVIPNVYTSKNAANIQPFQTLRIIENSKELQAAADENLHLLEAIIYKEGKTIRWNGLNISTDAPCALMLKHVGHQLEIHIADPTQKLSNIRLTVKNNTSKTQQIAIALPQAPFAGMSAKKIIQL